MHGRKQNLEKPSLKLIFKVGSNPGTPELSSNLATSCDGASERKFRKKRKMNDKTDSDEDSQLEEYCEDDLTTSNNKMTNSSSSRIQREKRNMNASAGAVEERTPLQLCLDHLHKQLQRKDPNGFFAFPVTDLIAPGYSKVISKAMDFSTMKKKIDSGFYQSVREYRDDFKLMMANCMDYNQPDTIYHKEGRRLLGVGLKYFGKERMNQMRRTFAFMSNLSKEDVDLDDDVIIDCDKESNANNNDINNINNINNSSNIANRSRYCELDRAPDLNASNQNVELGKFEAIPDELTASEILEQVQTAARLAAENLQTHAPNSKIGYLKKEADGTTVLNILNPDNRGFISEKERVVDLGGVVGRLVAGQSHVNLPKDDIRNKINPVTYLSYGAFSSYAPVYDSSNANVDKETTNLLLATYADETGVQYAKSLKEFVSGCGEYATMMVDNLLDVLTNGEHMKTEAILKEKELLKQQQLQQQQLQQQQQQNMQIIATAYNMVTTDNDNNPATCNLPSDSGPLGNNQQDNQLRKTSNLLLTLEEKRRASLSSSHWKRSTDAFCRPTDNEVDIARKVFSELAGLIEQTRPDDVIDIESVRRAMNFKDKLMLVPVESSQQQHLPAATAAEHQQQNVADTFTAVDNNQQVISNDNFLSQEQPATSQQQPDDTPATLNTAAAVVGASLSYDDNIVRET
ncbi:hypothetical protein HELRODRAFT_189500 [Helobdella robusta]|uniref:Bromo domain-containing protein n=1 Tax=Helobdella robusta TaxID=6412 RepID=T1FR38_HELRO|nr:hypothetical protein HELRODRAFT_189500 [Helobdella robusta]ESN92554.1 hypothetical protein HELRODRAFT_189500 [Helobdella robusta]